MLFRSAADEDGVEATGAGDIDDAVAAGAMATQSGVTVQRWSERASASGGKGRWTAMYYGRRNDKTHSQGTSEGAARISPPALACESKWACSQSAMISIQSVRLGCAGRQMTRQSIELHIERERQLDSRSCFAITTSIHATRHPACPQANRSSNGSLAFWLLDADPDAGADGVAAPVDAPPDPPDTGSCNAPHPPS